MSSFSLEMYIFQFMSFIFMALSLAVWRFKFGQKKMFSYFSWTFKNYRRVHFFQVYKVQYHIKIKLWMSAHFEIGSHYKLGDRGSWWLVWNFWFFSGFRLKFQSHISYLFIWCQACRKLHKLFFIDVLNICYLAIWMNFCGFEYITSILCQVLKLNSKA